jgi:hypothetical protein
MYELWCMHSKCLLENLDIDDRLIFKFVLEKVLEKI